jgi:hypothetical protein
MDKIIKLEAEIDLTKDQAETRVKKIEGVWEDFGYFLEATGFLAYQAMKYREWDEDKIIQYSTDYFRKCLADYKVKR